MITIDTISAKLVNEGITKVNYSQERAKNILSRCVAPVACVKFLLLNEDLIKSSLPEFLVTVVITRDGKELKRKTGQRSDACAFGIMHSLTSSSVDWAIKYEGYKVEIINETTNESYFFNS